MIAHYQVHGFKSDSEFRIHGLQFSSQFRLLNKFPSIPNAQSVLQLNVNDRNQDLSYMSIVSYAVYEKEAKEDCMEWTFRSLYEPSYFTAV